VDEKTRLLDGSSLSPISKPAIQTAIEKMREKIETAPASVFGCLSACASVSETAGFANKSRGSPREHRLSSRSRCAGPGVITLPGRPNSHCAAFSPRWASQAVVREMEVKAFQSIAIHAPVPFLPTLGRTNGSLGTSHRQQFVWEPSSCAGSANDLALAGQVIERWRSVRT